MKNVFLQLADEGRNQWWAYLIGILLILMIWFILGGLFTLVPLLWVQMDQDPATFFNMQTKHFEGVNPLFPFVSLNISFIMLFLAIWITVRFINKRPLKSLITPLPRVDWKRIFHGFLLFLIFGATASLVEFVFYPSIYTVSLTHPGRYLLFVLAALLLTPFQSTAEELLFRGYLMQALGRITGKFLFPAIGSAVLFMLPHLVNPEMTNNALVMSLNYFVIGLFFALITLEDGRLELAIGMHAANNLYAGLVVNYSGSALQTESLFLVKELNPLFSLVSIVIASCLIFILLFHRKIFVTRKTNYRNH
ncbi:CPBP family intramembrane metalloprotease [candidate division KSB1 bacterium]|nr:CPBP family intramembrane metalloprotease [candidate division KSB1 bacterium]